MQISQIRLSGVRVYDEVYAEFPQRVSALVGANGEGKTSLLEGIHVLGTTRSFRSPRLRDLLQTGSQSAVLQGRFLDPTHSLQIRLELREKQMIRKLEKDGRSCRVQDFCIPGAMVCLAPEHQGLIMGAPEIRRRYLDHLIFSLDVRYFQLAQEYHRAIAQKQALLRQELSWPLYQDQVEPWNAVIRTRGFEIRKTRANLLAELSPWIQKELSHIGPQMPELQLTYPKGACAVEEELRYKAMAEHRSGRTLCGPHLDDLSISLANQPAEAVCSQGERSSILLALKFSELDLIQHQTAKRPIFLLDDVGATLDQDRRQRLFARLEHEPIQALMSTSSQEVAAAAQKHGSALLQKQNEKESSGFSFARWVSA